MSDNNRGLINNIGEFYDADLEKEYFGEDMHKSIRFCKPVILFLGILNTLFLIPDYYLVTDPNAFRFIAIMRSVFIILVIILYIRINYMKKYSVLTYWVTAYELLGIAVFLATLLQYGTPNYIVQALGLIVVLLGIFMVPNRWVYTISVSLIGSLGFVFLSKAYIKNIDPSEFWAGVVYILLVIFLCCIFSFRDNYLKRIHYLNNKELIRLSTTDTLTGAFNRAKFDDELGKWIIYSRRYKAPLSVILFDIDDFKRINDLYGHLLGDQVIIEMSSLVMSSIRGCDVFARWGGEEFVIILPNTVLKNAIEFAERLKNDIASSKFACPDNITCSFGVSELTLNDDIVSLMDRCDKMLYRAKSDGKNKVSGKI